jgi:hypothetical protein
MLISLMGGLPVWSNQHLQSGTSMPSGAVHPIIARSEATKQSSFLPGEAWIASLRSQ